MLWIVFLVLLIAGALIAILLPLFRGRQPWILAGDQAEAMLEKLAEEKERVLRKLKDLDMEKESGAISELDYDELRQAYLQDAAMMNRRIGQLRGGGKKAAPPLPTSTQVEGSRK